MANTIWDQIPKVGIGFIDEEHQGLMDGLSRLHTTVAAGASMDEINQTGSALISACATHFWHEERTFLGTSYPRLEHHLRKHAHLKTILAAFHRSLLTEQQHAPLDRQLAFLKDWALDHIVTEDQPLADYLNAQTEPLAAR